MKKKRRAKILTVNDMARHVIHVADEAARVARRGSTTLRVADRPPGRGSSANRFGIESTDS